MRFLMDAQLPRALAKQLVALGPEAEHVFDIGMETATDRAIWSKATLIDAIIITKDEDFTQISRTGSKPQVVWLRVGNVTRGELLDKFSKVLPQISKVLPQIMTAIKNGERVIEVH